MIRNRRSICRKSKETVWPQCWMEGKDWNKNDNKTNEWTYKCSLALSLFICFVLLFFSVETFTMNVHSCRFGSSVCRYKEKTQQTPSVSVSLQMRMQNHFCICLSCVVHKCCCCFLRVFFALLLKCRLAGLLPSF